MKSNLLQIIRGVEVVHFAEPHFGRDSTLCGIGCEEVDDENVMTETQKPVNCKDCHDIIIAVRKLKIPTGKLVEPYTRF